MKKLIKNKQNIEASKFLRKYVIAFKFWRKSKKEKYNQLVTILPQLCDFYNTRECKIVIKNLNSNNDHYCLSNDTIYLYSPSIMTFIHEFGHHLQNNGYNLNPNCSDIELQCQQWSHTLFFMMAPKLYYTSLKSRKFKHYRVQLLNPIEI